MWMIESHTLNGKKIEMKLTLSSSEATAKLQKSFGSHSTDVIGPRWYLHEWIGSLLWKRKTKTNYIVFYRFRQVFCILYAYNFLKSHTLKLPSSPPLNKVNVTFLTDIHTHTNIKQKSQIFVCLKLIKKTKTITRTHSNWWHSHLNHELLVESMHFLVSFSHPILEWNYPPNTRQKPEIKPNITSLHELIEKNLVISVHQVLQDSIVDLQQISCGQWRGHCLRSIHCFVAAKRKFLRCSRQ